VARKITPTHVLLNQIELSSSASSVTFSNIPQGYGDLVLVCCFTTTGSNNQTIYFNSDTTGGNYTGVYMRGTGSAANSGATGQYISTTPGSQVQLSINIMDFSASDKHTTYISRADNASNQVVARAMRWSNTAAVTSVLFACDSNAFATNSTFSLYGVYA